MLDSLATEGDLTRTQLAEALAVRGVAATGHLLMILLAHLELNTLICSGRPAPGGEHTYAVLSARVPSGDDSGGPRPWRSWPGATSPATDQRPRRTWPTGPR